MVVVEDGPRYRYALVNFMRREPYELARDAGFIARLNAPYMPPERATWLTVDQFGTDPRDAAVAREAFHEAEFAFFRWFARYPALFRVERGNPEICVWFEDLRFLTPGRTRMPFRYGMCGHPGGPWRAYELEDKVRFPVH